ncbi:MAG: exodeoxyribonuclease VII large subunit [Dysgonamonadaceae bacterium]|jgi:exodeoxyribonuclease VII large subunit|nr:exodeoxyribonuclease VII large subunit [Dysgonamonadaceae bacterium]
MDFYTLSQLNAVIANKVKQAFPDTYWLLAETSDVRFNNGNCYLEFIEKEEKSNNIIAKARAYIWKNILQLLKPYFEENAGQAFVSGIKVLVKVSIDFNPVYGYGLTVYDIDPTYTLGDIQRRRQEILRQLEEEGVLNLNKELEMPLIPQRVAVVTSPTAAGYEDFLNHLRHNKYGFVFYPRLFPSIMQGEQTENSIIAALENIYAYSGQFDVVVIIRGGGASSDLLAFDSYLLASHCAQFPLPVITGIGHERDNTVLDFVAYHRAKTPTAVADYLVGVLEETSGALEEIRDSIFSGVTQIINTSNELLQKMTLHFPLYLNVFLEKQNYAVKILAADIQHLVKQFFQDKKTELKEKESFFQLSSPEYILSKGYSITLKEGKAVKTVKTLKDKDIIRTILAEGEVISVVEMMQ